MRRMTIFSCCLALLFAVSAGSAASALATSGPSHGAVSAKKEKKKKETAKEKKERKAREKAEKEAKEKEAQEKAEKEVKEKAEKESREKTEREAREKTEREARESREREAKEEREEAEEEAASTQCTRSKHCYGIAEFNVAGDAFAGDTVAIETSYAEVKGWRRQFFTNEMWACSAGTDCGDWLEGGAIDGRGSQSYRYFVAYKSPSAGFVFTEYPNGPGSSRFPVDIHAFPGGTLWYLTVAGEPTYGVDEMPPYSDTLETGLEETIDTNIINWGNVTPLKWWNPTNGESHEGWEGYNAAAGIFASRPACAEFPDGGVNYLYFVANNCEFGPAVVRVQSVHGPALKPGAGYEAPTSRQLSNSQLTELARRLSAGAGDASPTGIQAVQAQRRDALQALNANGTVPSAARPR